MNAKYKTKNSFLFNIKILENDKKYKKLKEIFIRKQDIYLIKLLEKKAKNNKNAKLNISLKKVKEDKSKAYKLPNENKFSEYKNIRIIKRKLDNSVNINNNDIIENTEDESKNNFKGLITSKIFNNNSSRNNKTMININAENNKNQVNDSNILRTIYENNKNDSFLKLKYNLNLINNQKQSKMPNSTNIRLPKNIKMTYKKFSNASSYDSRRSLLDNNLEQSKKINKKNPIYKNIFNKINLNEKNESIFNNNKKIYYKLNNKKIEFHKLFHLIKKGKKCDDIRKKIMANINNDKLRNINMSRNNNIINPIYKIIHSSFRTENINHLDNLFN